MVKIILMNVLHAAARDVTNTQGCRNKGGKRAATLPIFLKYSSKDPFLPYQYFRILALCHTNI